MALAQPSLAQGPFADLQGHSSSLEQLVSSDGAQAVMLVVWCSRCGSCRGAETQIVHLSQLWGRQVKVLAVDPHPADDPCSVRKYLQDKSLPLTVVLDPSQALLSTFAIDRTTTALIFDRHGKLRYFGPLQGEGSGFAADALKAVVAHRPVKTKTRPLRGCPIPQP